MAVEFIKIDKEARTATFNVDGQDVTRKIPLEFAGTINDYLKALKSGLEIEAEQKKVVVKEIDESDIGPEFLGV